MPSGMFIRQFLAYEIEFVAVVVDVEKVPRHGKASRDAGTSSRQALKRLAANHGSNAARRSLGWMSASGGDQCHSKMGIGWRNADRAQIHQVPVYSRPA
jgi:hypothetical protein